MPRPRRRQGPTWQRALGALSVGLLMLAFATAPAHAATACQSSAAMPETANLDQLQGTVLCLLNRERTSRGLARLKSNRKLETAAEKYARQMVASDFFSHVSPGGSTMMQRVRASGYLSGARGWTVGENIAYGTGHFATADEIMQGWMESPGHRANILHPGFKEVGVGIALGAPGQDGEGATYTTEFGRRI